MKTEDIRTLRILQEIEQSPAHSQRTLARRLNVSLGLVNSFVKRLAHKGYFKVTTIPKNRVRYILTPQGAAEKARLTMEYIQYSIQFYKKARARSASLFSQMAADGYGRVVFFGAGELAEIAYISLQETSVELVAVVDVEKAGTHFLGFEIVEPARLKNISFDKVLVTGVERQEAILTRLKQMGLSRDKTVVLDLI